MMRRFLVVLVMLAAIAGPFGAGRVAAQDDAKDRAESAATAQALFDLAADGDYNALYDQIHPDAHAVIPRAAAVGTFQEIYSAVQAGRSQVVGVQMVRWTWEVTGKTYDYAAAVDFLQPYVDNGQEAWLEDTMYLVQDNDGAWRWFFGSSPEFVQDAIQTYGSTSAVTQPLTEGDLLVNTVNDLDAFWRDVIHYTSFTYQSPAVTVVAQGDSAMSACGPAQGNFAGFYCPPDMTLYLDEPFLQQLEGQTPFAAAFVIAHEWAHHIQTGVNFVRVGANQQPDQWNEVYSVELELMADCLAGAWAQDATTRGLIQGDQDIQQAVDFALQFLGDPDYVGTYDPQAHGTGQMRATAILSGYQNGFLGCNITV
jgi:predicted metalloprotease